MAAQPTLMKLPLELLRMICNQLHDDWDQFVRPEPFCPHQYTSAGVLVQWAASTQATFRPLRFVNRTLSELAAEHYFKTLVIWPAREFPISEHSLWTLRGVSNKVGIRHLVQRLVFWCGNRFAEYWRPLMRDVTGCLMNLTNVRALLVVEPVPGISDFWRSITVLRSLLPRLQVFECLLGESRESLVPRSAHRFVSLALHRRYAVMGRDFINAQATLECLSLGALYTQPLQQPYTVYADLTLSTTTLRRLQLGALSLSGVKLAAWITSSQATLHVITMQWIKLTDGTWENVFASIANCLRINHLELGYLSYGAATYDGAGTLQRAAKAQWGPSRCLILTNRAQDVSSLVELQMKPYWYQRLVPKGSKSWPSLRSPPTGIYAPLWDQVLGTVAPVRRLTSNAVATSQSVMSDAGGRVGCLICKKF